jgi:hypothetical protein
LWVLGSLRAYKCCCCSCITAFDSIFLLKCFLWEYIRSWTCYLLLELMFSTIIKHLHGSLNSPFCVLLGHVLAILWYIQLWKLGVDEKSIDMTMSVQFFNNQSCLTAASCVLGEKTDDLNEIGWKMQRLRENLTFSWSHLSVFWWKKLAMDSISYKCYKWYDSNFEEMC